MIGRRLPLPPPRSLPWPLKPLESATTSLGPTSTGAWSCASGTILKGISRDGGLVVPATSATWRSRRRLNKYLVWHPLDHIHWELARPGPDGGASVGAQFASSRRSGENRLTSTSSTP
jgi:hypothetical protein